MGRLAWLLVWAFSGLGLAHRQRPLLWQADLQVRSLTVSEDKGNLSARVVIATEVGEALGARVEVLLPVGVGIVSLGTGCVAGPNRTGIRELRARGERSLGAMQAGADKGALVLTTMPPAGIARGFGVVVMSETPDPKPSNNFL